MAASLVQSTGNVESGAVIGTTHSAVFGSAVTAGNLLLAFAAHNLVTGTVPQVETDWSVTDNINTGEWSTLSSQAICGLSTSPIALFARYRLSVSSGAGASTLRVSFNSPSTKTGQTAIALLEYSGISSLALAISTTVNGSNASLGGNVSSGGVLFVTAGTIRSANSTIRSTMAGGYLIELQVDSGSTFSRCLAVADLITSSLGTTGVFHKPASTDWSVMTVAFENSTVAPGTRVIDQGRLLMFGVQTLPLVANLPGLWGSGRELKSLEARL